MEAALSRHCPARRQLHPSRGRHVPLADPAAQRQCHGPVRRGDQEKVAFVPGAPFYVRPEIQNTLRLSFSCVDEATTEEGIKRLCRALARML